VQVARPRRGFADALTRVQPRDDEGSNRPIPICALPARVEVHTIEARAQLEKRPWALPIGIEGDELAPAVITVHGHEHVLVAGPRRSGRTNALAVFASVTRAADYGVDIVTVSSTRSRLSTSVR